MLKLEITDILADLKKYKKPIICCSAGGDFTIKLSRILERKGIPVYQTPRRAVSAMSSLVKYWKYIQSK
jgi:acyl-CoA synthetase (NDP forming)